MHLTLVATRYSNLYRKLSSKLETRLNLLIVFHLKRPSEMYLYEIRWPYGGKLFYRFLQQAMMIDLVPSYQIKDGNHNM